MSDIEEIALVSSQSPEPAANISRLHGGGLYASPLAAGSRLQEFQVSAVIGQGGFGIVYLARDLSLQRMVAIKEYMPAHLAGRNADATVRPLTAGQSDVFDLGRRSFINEARMLARFKHPGLLEVLRFWEQNGTAYMAMPYYDGATLTQYLKRHPGVATEAWLKKTLKPLVEALGHMHEEDCFHRDVAPDNILVLKDGSAVLLDLGAARRVIADDAQAMTVMLKPGYAPIEQYSDDPRFRQGPWTDIYAMAAVFFFGVTGKAPPASASRVMRDSVSPLSNVQPDGFSENFLHAIDKGLSLQPEDRPRSIAEFKSLLYATGPLPSESDLSARKTASKGAAHGLDGSLQRGAPAEVDDPFAPPAPGVSTWMVVAGGLAVMAVVIAGSWYAMQPGAVPGDVAAASAVPADVMKDVRKAAGMAPPSTMAGPDVDMALVAFPAIATPAPAKPAISSPAVAAPALAAPAAVTQSPSPAVAPVTVPVAPASASPRKAPAKAPTESTSEAKPAATAATGTLLLAVKPWAEVRVDGVLKGISPPIKQLTLPAGRHTIEFRNPASPPVTKQVEVHGNQKTTVSQHF